MKFFTFLQESDGFYSWGRVAGCFTVASAIYMAVHIVRATGTIDISILAGLAAFGAFPFGVSKGIAAVAKASAGQ
jgi:hypothetical protein